MAWLACCGYALSQESFQLGEFFATRGERTDFVGNHGLNPEETRAEAAGLLRSLIDKIVLKPQENGKEYAIDLHGDLAGILTIASVKHK